MGAGYIPDRPAPGKARGRARNAADTRESSSFDVVCRDARKSPRGRDFMSQFPGVGQRPAARTPVFARLSIEQAIRRIDTPRSCVADCATKTFNAFSARP
jgi:hypothetical protein